MLRRKIAAELERWLKSAGQKALFITGSRQIGKSYSIRAFGKASHATYIELNLMENRQAKDALLEARDADDFISRVTLLSGKSIAPGKTLGHTLAQARDYGGNVCLAMPWRPLVGLEPRLRTRHHSRIGGGVHVSFVVYGKYLHNWCGGLMSWFCRLRLVCLSAYIVSRAVSCCAVPGSCLSALLLRVLQSVVHHRQVRIHRCVLRHHGRVCGKG